ncbi:BMP family ABC transporter substrate-binding protein [Alkalihalobacillus sp. LMS39]|nr:BMP family ABC transporter substrate-binding protein [Alkalihalobacillus sp. LMS39]UOE96454.1 BMP family ABC transporter substrate-binding protein [Alkalihalobacillus sp. LMS39]
MNKFLLCLFLVIAFVITGCGTDGGGGAQPEPTAPEDTEEEQQQDEAAGDAEDFRVAMVTDVGGIDDKSFNQSAWEGMTRFGEEFGLEEGTDFKYLQSSSEAEYAPNLNSLVREEYDLVWAIGFLMGNDVKTVAQQRPESQLAIVDMVVEGDDGELLDNVANITFKEHEGSFLVGVIAGLTTETNQVGFLGGVEGALIKKFENGFKAGVKTVNPDADVIVQYAESFNDESTGQQIANAMYTQGADIIYHASGGTGKGLFTEAKNRKRNNENVWAIGVDRDQHEEGLPENVTLTSMIKRVDNALYAVNEQTMEGNYPGGEILEFGLEDEAVGIAENTENVSDEAQERVNEYIEQIQAGDIEVPQTDDEYAEFIENL